MNSVNNSFSNLSVSDRSSIVLWLFSGCFLIFLMVVVGGVTRLTGSGLSITRWDVVTGTIPPLNEADWNSEFELYKQSPQFREINSHFELDEFKGIYWWEYIHRLLGRVIGMVFVIPFLWFLIRKKIRGLFLWQCLLLFSLGGLQGFLGWYMVKSGLIDEPNVSHFRLALHLSTAFLTFCFTLWFAMNLINTVKVRYDGWRKVLIRLSQVTLIVLSMQIVFGAFVAGLKAGLIYNTWPLMGDKIIPDSFWFALKDLGWLAFIDNMSGVQLMHRYLAYIVVILILGMFWYAWLKNNSKSEKLLRSQYISLIVLLFFVAAQFVLGVFTLLYAVPLWLGVLHQAVALLLLGSLVYTIHRLTHISVSEFEQQSQTAI